MFQYITFLESAISNNVDYVGDAIKSIIPQGLDLLKRIIVAFIIIFIGKRVIRYIITLFEKYFNRTKMEPSVSGFLLALIRAIFYILLVAIIVVNVIGIESSSIVALIGSAGLSIGLALQGGLSNFAGGVLILILKPFHVGDYIIAGGNEGTVTTIDIFYTRLLTMDNKLLVMPNGMLSNNNIINVSNEPNRRLELLVPIDYSENIKKVKELILEILNKDEMILKDQEISVYVNGLNESSISIGVRVWVANVNYLSLKWNLLERIKNDFDQNQIKIPYNQLEVNIRNQK